MSLYFCSSVFTCIRPTNMPMISAKTDASAIPFICILKAKTNTKLNMIFDKFVAITILSGVFASCIPMNHPINTKLTSVAGMPQILI